MKMKIVMKEELPHSNFEDNREHLAVLGHRLWRIENRTSQRCYLGRHAKTVKLVKSS